MTCATPGYHPPESKWHLAPDFTHTALSEDSSIANAVSIVLETKSKQLPDREKQILISNIEKLAGGNSIKHLNNLTEKEWNNLDTYNIPKICKLYLRHLLVQSFKYKSKLQLLQHDFNWGLDIDWNNPQIESNINQLLSLGFSFEDAAQAVIVTDNQSIDEAINYALTDPDSKQKQYQLQKRKLNRFQIHTLSDSDYHLYRTICGESVDDEKYIQQMKQKIVSGNDIFAEMKSCKQTIFALKNEKKQLQNCLHDHKLMLYTHFVSGILANGELNICQVTEWKKYRDTHGIAADEHVSVLNKFGYDNDDDLDAIKTYINNTSNANELERGDSGASLQESKTKMALNTSTKSSNECVICYEDIALITDEIYMLCPCYHICLCQKCALKYYGPPHMDQKCPICCTEVTDLKKVFFS